MLLLRSARNYDGKAEKVIGFFFAKNNVARELAFLYFYLPSLLDHDVKFLIFTFYRGPKHKATIFFSLFLTSIRSLRIKLQTNSTNFDELNHGVKAMKFERVGIYLNR